MSTTHRPSAKVAGALAVVAAIAFTASTAPSQVIDKPDANLPAVQAADLGPDAFDGRIEVQLDKRSQDALVRGGGWEALASGLSLLHEGERPLEATIHYAVVDRSGNVLESRTSDPVKLAGGHSKVGAHKELDFMRKAIGGSGFKSVPAGAYFPNETYFPDSTFLPHTKFFPDSEWDARHTVTNPDNMDRVRKPAGDDSGEKRKPRGPGVFDESDERAVGINPGRSDKRAVGINPGRVDKRAVGINPGRMLVITVVPTDPDVRGQIEVRPLIVDLDAE